MTASLLFKINNNFPKISSFEVKSLYLAGKHVNIITRDREEYIGEVPKQILFEKTKINDKLILTHDYN